MEQPVSILKPFDASVVWRRLRLVEVSNTGKQPKCFALDAAPEQKAAPLADVL